MLYPMLSDLSYLFDKVVMKFLDFKVVIILITYCLFTTASAFSSDLNLVVVDLQQVIAKSELGKSARSNLEKEMEAVKSKLAKEAQAIKALEAKLKKQSALLSKSAMEDKVSELEDKKKDLRRSTQDEEEELKIKNTKFIKTVIDNARIAIQKVSEEEGFDFVLERSGGSVIYADNRIDVTDKIVDKLNSLKRTL